MAARIPVALIGTGRAAEVHARALATLEDSKFVAVFDRDARRAAEFAARYDVTPYSDLDAMLTSCGAVAATVCTPHPTHPSMAVACAEAGLHVLVEKPLAVTLDDADRMISAARRAGVNLGVISQRRWYPPVVRMKEAIDAGKIGTPALGLAEVLGWRDASYFELDQWRGRWDSEGGGVLVNQAAHQLDLLIWFMGPASDVGGFWGNVNHPSVEVEDTAVAAIRFARGGLGTVVASNSQKPGLYAKVHVHGDNGASIGVQTDGGSTFVTGVTTASEPPFNDLWTIPGEEDRLGGWQSHDRNSMAGVEITSSFHTRQIADFLSSIREERDPLVTGDDGRRVLELFTAIYRSHAERRVIAVDRPCADAMLATTASYGDHYRGRQF